MTRAFVHFMAYLTVANARLQNREDRGATAVEYGLLVGLIAVAIITLVATLGDNLAAFFNEINGTLAAN